MEVFVTIAFYGALAFYLLASEPTIKTVARVVAGVAAAILCVMLILGQA